MTVGKKVTLYKVTGDRGQAGMHALKAEDRITHYRILDETAFWWANVQSLIVPKGRLGDLSLTPGVALVKFLCRLEKEEASLVRLLRGVRALRVQAFTMAEGMGVQIDLGEAGAEAEGVGVWAQPPVLDLPDFANERDLAAESGVEDAWVKWMIGCDPGPEPPLLQPGDQCPECGDGVDHHGECSCTRAQPFVVGAVGNPDGLQAGDPCPWCTGFLDETGGCECGYPVALKGEDHGSGEPDPEDDLNRAALNRGQP